MASGSVLTIKQITVLNQNTANNGCCCTGSMINVTGLWLSSSSVTDVKVNFTLNAILGSIPVFAAVNATIRNKRVQLKDARTEYE